MCKIIEEYGDERAAEAFKKGEEAGAQQKAIEAAVIAVKEFKASPEDAAKKMNAPLDKVKEALNK